MKDAIMEMISDVLKTVLRIMGINVRDNLEVLPNARQYVEMESELEMNNVIIKIN